MIKVSGYLRYILMHIPSFLVLNMFLQDIGNFYRSLSLGMKYQSYPPMLKLTTVTVKCIGAIKVMFLKFV